MAHRKSALETTGPSAVQADFTDLHGKSFEKSMFFVSGSKFAAFTKVENDLRNTL